MDTSVAMQAALAVTTVCLFPLLAQHGRHVVGGPRRGRRVLFAKVQRAVRQAGRAADVMRRCEDGTLTGQY